MMKDEILNVSVKVKITEDDIDDIVASALEDGINYWCEDVEVVGEYLGEFAAEQISRGGVLKLYDRESGTVHKLDKDRLLIGIKMYIEDMEIPRCILGEYERSIKRGGWYYSLDSFAMDASVADIIVQYGIFREIVYQ